MMGRPDRSVCRNLGPNGGCSMASPASKPPGDGAAGAAGAAAAVSHGFCPGISLFPVGFAPVDRSTRGERMVCFLGFSQIKHYFYVAICCFISCNVTVMPAPAQRCVFLVTFNPSTPSVPFSQIKIGGRLWFVWIVAGAAGAGRS